MGPTLLGYQTKSRLRTTIVKIKDSLKISLILPRGNEGFDGDNPNHNPSPLNLSHIWHRRASGATNTSKLHPTSIIKVPKSPLRLVPRNLSSPSMPNTEITIHDTKLSLKMTPLTSRKTDLAYFCFCAMFATSMICSCSLPCLAFTFRSKVFRDRDCKNARILLTFRKYLHLTVMDLIPLWPKAIVPTILKDNQAWYLKTFNDQLMIKFEPWFASFVTIEALYQLPMTLWFLFALPKGIPLPPQSLAPIFPGDELTR